MRDEVHNRAIIKCNINYIIDICNNCDYLHEDSDGFVLIKKSDLANIVSLCRKKAQEMLTDLERR